MDTALIFSCGALAIFVCLSGFFAGAETALTAVSKARIHHLVMEGNKRARTASKLREMKEELIGAILLGNTAVHVAASSLATATAIGLWGEAGVPYVAVFMTLMVLIFGEVLPKTYAIQNAERCALIAAPFIWFFIRLFSPVVRAVQWFNRAFMRLFGVDITRDNTLISATDAIRGTIELYHREGTMVKQDRDMLGSILDLNDITVSDIMVHRTDIETIDLGDTAREVVNAAMNSVHSRIPLWRDTPDNIVGVLHVKALVREITATGKAPDTDGILRIAAEPWFIPETTSLRDQLLAFRQRRQHFAVVVDEYGAVLGIVTLEDIIEEIVGDIDDEHTAQTSPAIERLADDMVLAPGSMAIRDFNRELDWGLPDDNAATLAGLVIHEVRQIPEAGAVFEFHGCRFTVEEKEANRLTRIRVQHLAQTGGGV